MKQRARQPVPIGTKFGLLTIINEGESVYQNKVWRRMVTVRCNCGKEKVVQLANLSSQSQKSCGEQSCINEWKRREQAAINAKELQLINRRRAEQEAINKQLEVIQNSEDICVYLAKLGNEELLNKARTDMFTETRKLLVM